MTRNLALSDGARGRIIRVKHGDGHPFTKVANEVIRDASLSPAAFTLLVHLLSKPNDWTIRKAELVNAREWGRHTVQAAIRRLKELGYLTVRKHRGASGRFEYEWIVFETRTLRDEMDKRGTLFESPPEPKTGSGESTEKRNGVFGPIHQSRFTVHGPTVHGESAHIKTKGTKTEEQKQQHLAPSARNGAAPAAAGGSALVDALIAAGIGEPTRSELAKLAGITPAMVKRCAAEARDRGKGPGVTVQNIRVAADQARLRATQRNRRDDAVDRRAEQRRQHERATEAERERIQAMIEALPDDVLTKHAEAVKGGSRSIPRDADPRTSPILQAAIVARIDQELNHAATKA